MELGVVKEENKRKNEDDIRLISSYEEIWVQYYHFLKQRGYRLRPRYHPDWVPSWRLNPVKRGSYYNEDSIHGYANLVDAVCERDGKQVMLKRIDMNSEELPISLYVSSPSRRLDPRNHCVQVLDVILIPACETHVIMVMPLLYEHAELPFRHVGEFVEIAEQLSDCLDFLHDHNIVHRDYCRFNVLIDPEKLLPKGFHPFSPCSPPDGRENRSRRLYWRERWSVRPNRYFVIDFGYSKMLRSKEGNVFAGKCGQDVSVPEMAQGATYDPFPVDVYHLGNMLLKLSSKYRPNKDITNLQGLAKRMTQPDPALRPTAKEVAKEVHAWAEGVSYFSRRRRIWPDQSHFTFFWKLLVRIGLFNPI